MVTGSYFMTLNYYGLTFVVLDHLKFDVGTCWILVVLLFPLNNEPNILGFQSYYMVFNFGSHGYFCPIF